MSGLASSSALSDAFRTFCQTCHQVDGWMGLPFSLRNSLPSGAVPNRSMCSRSMTTSSGGTGTLRAAYAPGWSAAPWSCPSVPGARAPGRRRCTPGQGRGWNPRTSGDPILARAARTRRGSAPPPPTGASWPRTCSRRTRQTACPAACRCPCTFRASPRPARDSPLTAGPGRHQGPPAESIPRAGWPWTAD